ncbi:MAG: ABC transporter permease [Lachnospiraceae bacterium]|nr:ABC transporter permease [Lachnospiraceae bacterium]
MRCDMGFMLESKKVKRTGFVPVFVAGGIISALIPVLNMAVRHKIYTNTNASPVNILFDANWSIMAMLNVLLIVMCACIIYNSEYTDNAIQKMRMLPVHESNMYFGKLALIILMCIAVFIIESCGIVFCIDYWFTGSTGTWHLLFKSFVYEMVLIIPAVLFSLFIASAFKNMWITLGTGVVCVFMATMLPTDNFVLSLFPFAMPFQIFTNTAPDTINRFIIAAVIESAVIIVMELLLIKIRRISE